MSPTTALLLMFASSLEDRRSKTFRGEKHLPDCRVGQWVDGWHGAPCSTRCAQDRTLVALTRAHLASAETPEPRQMELLRERAS